ncbi:MAG: hypothetical protein SFY81_00790 [Verrucomicrobiota bacterium]|nr:hypothetical protein [Verrucomicrobiota bacterium]
MKLRIFAFCLCMLGQSLHAAVVTWTNTAGGDWSSAANWQPNQVPGASDTAIITSGTDFTVQLNSNVTIYSLTLGGGAGSQTLQLAGTLTSAGEITVSANGILNVQSGGLSGLVRVNNGGEIHFSTTTQKSLYRTTLLNEGTIRWLGGPVTLGATPTTLITNLGLFEISADAGMSIGIGGPTPRVVNLGTIRKIAGSGTTTFSNFQLQQLGTVEVETGSLALNGSDDSILGGTVNVALGAAIDLKSGTFREAGGVFTGQGVRRFSGGNLLLRTNLLSGLSLESGTISIASTFQAAGEITNLVLNGATLIGSNRVSGLLVINEGGIEGDVTNEGTLRFAGNASKTLYRTTLINEGTVEWQGGGILVGATPATIITNKGIWEITGNSSISVGIGGPNPIFVNEGILRKSGGTGISSFSNIHFENNGTVEIEIGTFQLHGQEDSIFAGTVDVSEGASFDARSGTYIGRGGSFSGAGTRVFTGGTLLLEQNFLPGLSLTGGDVKLGAEFQNGGAITNLTINGTTLVGTNVVDGGSLVFLSGGIEGMLTIREGSLLQFSGSGQKTLYRATVVNEGTVRWLGGTVSVGSTPTTIVTNSGLWEILGNNSFSIGIGGPTPKFVNSGVLRKSGGTGQSTFSNIMFANTGAVEIETGSFHLSGNENSIMGGTFSALENSTFQMSSGTYLEAGGSFSGDGTLRMTGGLLTLRTNLLEGLSLQGGDVQVIGTFQAAGMITNLTLKGATLIGTNLVGAGILNIFSGGLEGQTTVLPGGEIRFSGTAQKTLYRSTLINQGTIRWVGGQLAVGSTPATVVTNIGLWEISADSSYSIGIGGPTPKVINLGTVRKIGGAGITQFSNIQFINEGNIEILSGTFQFLGSENSALGGSISVTQGATFQLSSGTFIEAGGVFSGEGARRFTGGTLQFVQDILPGLSLDGGSILVSSNFQAGGKITNLTLNGSALAGVNVVGAGTLTINDGGVDGQLTIETNGALHLDSSNNKTFYRSTLINHGIIRWRGGNLLVGSTPATLVTNFGVWELSSDNSISIGIGGPNPSIENHGTIIKKGGAGVSTFSNIRIQNQGVIVGETGTIRLPNNFIHSDGILRLAGGKIESQGKLNFVSGRLEGSGSFGSSLFTGGIISPGVNGPGKITFVSGLAVDSGVTIEIDGTGGVAGSGYDQLAVTGGMNVTNATLQINSLGEVAVGTQLVILENDLNDAANVSFNSYPEGVLFDVGTQLFRLRYASGTGNDVALVRDDGGVRLTALAILEDGSFRLRGLGTNFGTYQISASTNLNHWVEVGSTDADEAGEFFFVDTNAVQFPYRFYRSFGPGVSTGE